MAAYAEGDSAWSNKGAQMKGKDRASHVKQMAEANKAERMIKRDQRRAKGMAKRVLARAKAQEKRPQHSFGRIAAEMDCQVSDEACRSEVKAEAKKRRSEWRAAKAKELGCDPKEEACRSAIR